MWREPRYGLFMITGHPEAMAIYADPASFPSDDLPSGTYSSCNVVSGTFVKLSESFEGDDVSDIIVRCRNELPFSDQLPTFDPPTHTAHRHLLLRLITPNGSRRTRRSCGSTPTISSTGSSPRDV